MNPERFLQACKAAETRAPGGIGTLGEKTLHAVLKRYFEESEESHEIRIGKYVADIVGEDGIIEIQTRNFEKLRGKLEAFLPLSRVTVVYPVPGLKWLCWIDPETGETSKRRKSPKAGVPQSVFSELYRIKPFVTHPNFRLCIVMLELEELRFLNGWSKDGKKGSSRCDRIPAALLEELYFSAPADYLALVPECLPEQFLVKDYRKATGLPRGAAGTALNLLQHIGALERVGKQGNAFVYARNRAEDWRGGGTAL